MIQSSQMVENKETQLDRLKRTLQVDLVRLSTDKPSIFIKDSDAKTAVVRVYGNNIRRKYITRLTKQFEKNICYGCVLRENEPLQCTGMRSPRKIYSEYGGYSDCPHPNAEITSKTMLNKTYWAALASRIPCRPEVDF